MPYKIITKTKIIIQYKLLDFIGTSSLEVIDCRTKEGRQRYEDLFHRPYPYKQRKSNQIRMKSNQRRLTDFLDSEGSSKVIRRKRPFYKRHYNPIHPKFLKPIPLPFVDQQAIKSKSGYQGSLYQLFLDANLDYFSQWQHQNQIYIQSSNAQVEDIVRLEIVRIRLGIPVLSTYLQMLRDWHELREECGLTAEFSPSQPHYLRVLKLIGPEPIKQYFLLLQKKCSLYNLYDDNLDMWDGRFLYSYNSGRKLSKEGDPTDPNLGVYVHQSKYFGIGYLESRILNGRFLLPKYYDLVNPQWNDNQTFQHTFQNMIGDGISPAKVFLSDGGPKGKKSRELVKFFHSIPIFAAPKNAAGLVLVTKKSRFFYAIDIPDEYRLALDKFYDSRTGIEQSFSYDSLVYNIQTINHLLPDLCTQFLGFLNCQPLLTAIAAVQTDQFHLVTSRQAFRQLSLVQQGISFSEILEADSISTRDVVV